MATLLEITGNPSSYAAGVWPETAMNSGAWRFTFTFQFSSAGANYSGFCTLFGGPIIASNSGGLWIVNNGSLDLYTTNDDLVFSRPLSWGAGTAVTITINSVAKTVAIAGASTGNGTFSFTEPGPYFFAGTTLTAGGLTGESGFACPGTFSNIDDGTSGEVIVADPGAIAIAGGNAGLLAGARVPADGGALVIAGSAAALTASPAKITASAGAISIAGGDASVRSGARFAADPGEFVIGGDASLRAGARITAAAGTVTIGGGSAALVLSSEDAERLLENALWGWVVASSGLPESNVIWGRHSPKNGPVPQGTFISLRVLAIGRVSDDWVRSREVGGVIEHISEGPRQQTLEITCFAGEAFGAGQAHQLLDRVLTSLRWPSVQARLVAGNVGIGRRGPIRVVDGVRSTMFDPRAIVEVGLHTMQTIADPEPGSAIEAVEVENEIADGVIEVP